MIWCKLDTLIVALEPELDREAINCPKLVRRIEEVTLSFRSCYQLHSPVLLLKVLAPSLLEWSVVKRNRGLARSTVSFHLDLVAKDLLHLLYRMQ